MVTSFFPILVCSSTLHCQSDLVMDNRYRALIPSNQLIFVNTWPPPLLIFQVVRCATSPQATSLSVSFPAPLCHLRLPTCCRPEQTAMFTVLASPLSHVFFWLVTIFVIFLKYLKCFLPQVKTDTPDSVAHTKTVVVLSYGIIATL